MPIISEDVKILNFKLLEIQNYLAIQLKTKLEKTYQYTWVPFKWAHFLAASHLQQQTNNF
jgi:hypothetical protein